MMFGGGMMLGFGLLMMLIFLGLPILLVVTRLQWAAHVDASPVAAAAEVTPTTESDTGSHAEHIPCDHAILLGRTSGD
ncbi:MAG TPA: hypothetical protein VJL59_03370 [Anaerolineales bacterium]|nr:hypothetical protein [Anaerolineales bacterium]